MPLNLPHHMCLAKTDRETGTIDFTCPSCGYHRIITLEGNSRVVYAGDYPALHSAQVGKAALPEIEVEVEQERPCRPSLH